ncbi:NosR/NirI family nitrous oxide reductase transcriptional regulator [Varunaivibrio sulfuroxidans]|uniref:NosR/NirI family nitrous oxide reductase transcriptional regulator n=1 Tax=Varunaivibrio sulfuroxidans TaxID=1773489 RepID=A0A4R3JE00_9PROT|nr:NosR/NirI family nitrous oxide reductase transcriptional regulator [Varunaivibrio sulfuroxidans]
MFGIPRLRGSVSFFVCIVALAILAIAPSRAQGADDFHLAAFLPKIQIKTFFPGADRIEIVKDTPPVAAVYGGGKKLGYVFLNSDFVDSTGYSGKPIRILIAITTEGVIVNAKLVEHHEPIVLVGIPEARIVKVFDDYRGLNIAHLAEGGTQDHKLDIVSGATVTIMVIDDSMLRSAIKVGRKYGLGGLTALAQQASGPKFSIAPGPGTVKDWPALLGDGSVRHLKITVGEINQAFAKSDDPEAKNRPESGDPKDTFIDFYAALATVPTIGRSLLGEGEYKNLKNHIPEGRQAILLAGTGRFSFKGSGYVRGGIFDRFHIIQGENSVRFRDRHHKRLSRIAAKGAPKLKEVDLFYIPKNAKFDPTQPWRIELLVNRPTGPTKKAFLTYTLGYQTPKVYLRAEASAKSAYEESASGGKTPLWRKLWHEKFYEVVALSVAVGLLTIIFFFQDWVVQRPRLIKRTRLAFLIFTLFGLGWYANGQISVVNVMTFFNALITKFSWTYFLREPLIFILWFSVVVSLIFWGRGAFCGWLCPFGALQEILSKIAKAFKVPQIQVPWAIHERLWPLKYLIFLVLFGLSLYSTGLAERWAEVEPFKTAIVLKFAREWPFVIFALTVLSAGLFIERFYCRYLCPLGAALAIPGRLRMFEWLRRYKECGSPCHRCAQECMVQAIHPDGHINPNECLYCLHCQILYHDDQKCPVVVQRRQRRERRAALSAETKNVEGKAT